MVQNYGKGIVQTTNNNGSENYSGRHNSLVIGSNPIGPISYFTRNLMLYLFLNYLEFFKDWEVNNQSFKSKINKCPREYTTGFL